MSAQQSFATTLNYRLTRAEYLVGLAACAALFVAHAREVRLVPALILFAYIDLIGYLPGLAVHVLRGGRVPRFFYVLYNVTHSWFSAAAVMVAWATVVRPEWALLAIPIHLLGDRALLGNFFKPWHEPFEPPHGPRTSHAPRARGGREAGAATGPESILLRRDRGAPPSDAAVLESLQRHADHPSGFLTYSEDVQHFTAPAIPGVVAYRRRGRHLFCLGGPFAAPRDRGALLVAFRAWAATHRLRVTAVQVRREDVPIFARAGFSVDHFGLSYSVDLRRFQLGGKALAKVRQNVSRARREGVTVEEWDAERAARSEELAAIDAAWIRAKGRLVKKMEFLVGERGGRGAPHRRTFVALVQGRPVAYVSYSPAFGSRPGYLYDLTRRLPSAPVGTIEAIQLAAMTALASSGSEWLHLGLTPFVDVDPPARPVEASSRVVRRVVAAIGRYGSALYPARAGHVFKMKWNPAVIEPEYLAFEGGPSPAALWQMARLVRAL